MIEYAKVDTKMVPQIQAASQQQPVYENTILTQTNSITESTGGHGNAKDLAPAQKAEPKPEPRPQPRIEAKPEQRIEQRSEPRSEAVRPRPTFNSPPPAPKAPPASPAAPKDLDPAPSAAPPPSPSQKEWV